MKTKILRIIKKVGISLGIYINIGKLTDQEDLRAFLQKLYPVKVDKKLIRVGAKGDGGYIIPDDLDGVEALFSPGVGSKQDFDFECANNGMKVFMADASVDGPVNNHENYIFTKKYIGALDDNKEFMSIEEWLNSANLKDNSELMLQMDIEGYEYEVIYSMPIKVMKKFRIMIIEFHQLDFLLNKFMFEKFKNAFLKILQTHYVVHIHPNNCCEPIVKDDIAIPPVLEFTFIRKDRVENKGFVMDFPSVLDVDCTSNSSLVLPKCWYKNIVTT